MTVAIGASGPRLARAAASATAVTTPTGRPPSSTTVAASPVTCRCACAAAIIVVGVTGRALPTRSTAVWSLSVWGRATAHLLVLFGMWGRERGLAPACHAAARRGAAPDAPAGDLVRDDADPVGLVAERPVVQRQARHTAQIVGVVQLGCTPLDEHAPAGGVGGIDAVDLVADRGAAQQAAQLAARVGAEHDRVAVHHVVDGVDLGGAVVEDADAAHGCRGEQRPALGGAEVLEPGSSIDRAHGISSWSVALRLSLGPGAERWAGANVPLAVHRSLRCGLDERRWRGGAGPSAPPPPGGGGGDWVRG